MPEFKKIREMSEFESFFAKFDVNNVGICYFEGKVAPKVMMEAIGREVERHPLLSSCIRQEGGSFFFYESPQTVLDITVVENTDHRPLDELIHSALNQKLPIEKRLCKFIFVVEDSVDSLSEGAKSTLISIFHHAASDAISGLEFHKSVLKSCRMKLENGIFNEKPKLPMMQPIEYYSPKSFSKQEMDLFVKDYNRKVRANEGRIIEPNDSSGSAVPEIKVLHRKLSKCVTIGLIKKCKENPVSVHGLICAAHLIALKKVIDQDADKMTLCLHSPIDIRSRLEPPMSNEHMFAAAIGCISGYEIHPDTSIWELSKEVESRIKEYIRSDDVYKGLTAFNKTRSTAKIPVALSVTNVGAIKVPEDNAKLKLKSIYGVPCFPLPVLCVLVRTFNNRLTLSYPYAEPIFSREQIEALDEYTFREIESSCKGS